MCARERDLERERERRSARCHRSPAARARCPARARVVHAEAPARAFWTRTRFRVLRVLRVCGKPAGDGPRSVCAEARTWTWIFCLMTATVSVPSLLLLKVANVVWECTLGRGRR